jgi:hypothetical protein
MRRLEHCQECAEKRGNPWDKVHAWLEATAGEYWPWVGHRQIRHHTEGVEEVRRMWGDEAAEAAELHIIADEGYIPTRAQIEKKYGSLEAGKEFSKDFNSGLYLPEE